MNDMSVFQNGNIVSRNAIWEMLQDINNVMDSQDNVYCLQEAIANYVDAIQEFFVGNKSLEEVKQSFHREVGCTNCIRCDIELNEQNYTYENNDQEFICGTCLEKEFL